MLQFELTHSSSSSQHGMRVPGGGVYVNFRFGKLTREEDYVVPISRLL